MRSREGPLRILYAPYILTIFSFFIYLFIFLILLVCFPFLIFSIQRVSDVKFVWVIFFYLP
jgi:hypothetical protein